MGTGVAVGRGVAVGGARVGGGADCADAGRLPMMSELASAGIRLGGEARLVPGNCARARTTTANGSSSASPRTYRSGPPPGGPDSLEPAGVPDSFDPFDACICHLSHIAVREPGRECPAPILLRSKLLY